MHHHHDHSNNPAIMQERFSKMPLHDAGLFVIRRLHAETNKTDRPTPLIRSVIHSFVFITKGETLISIGEESYLFKKNECAIIPAGQFFSIRYYNNCEGYMGGFHTDFLSTGTDGKNILQAFVFLRQWGNHKVFFDEQHSSYVRNIFERLCNENENSKNKDIIKAYLTTLLFEINETLNKTAHPENDLSTNNKLCNDFVESVFAQPNQRLSVSHYAEKLCVSQTHLQKVVKRFTGKTPLAWINEAIVLEAKVLLNNTELSIAEIANKVGILDPSYFSRLFKKQVGMTPAAFRNELKNP